MTPRLYRSLEPVAGDCVRAMGLDPITIVLVIQALAAILQIVRECWEINRWSQIKMAGCSPVGRSRMRRAIRKAIGEAGFTRIGGEDFLTWIVHHVRLYHTSEIQCYLADLG